MPTRGVRRRTVLEPCGGRGPAENVRTPVALPPEPRPRLSEPVVERTAMLLVFTTVAVPTIRPPSSRRETWRTESGNDVDALLPETQLAEACVPTRALAVNADARKMLIALMIRSRSRRDRGERPCVARLMIDRCSPFGIGTRPTHPWLLRVPWMVHKHTTEPTPHHSRGWDKKPKECRRTECIGRPYGWRCRRAVGRTNPNPIGASPGGTVSARSSVSASRSSVIRV